MIYAIQCRKWVKFGRTQNSVEARLRELQVGNPFPLKLLASAEWPKTAEPVIHAHLIPHHYQGEWFHNVAEVKQVVSWLKQDNGLELFYEIIRAKGKHYLGCTPEMDAFLAMFTTRTREACAVAAL